LYFNLTSKYKLLIFVVKQGIYNSISLLRSSAEIYKLNNKITIILPFYRK